MCHTRWISLGSMLQRALAETSPLLCSHSPLPVSLPNTVSSNTMSSRALKVTHGPLNTAHFHTNKQSKYAYFPYKSHTVGTSESNVI